MLKQKSDFHSLKNLLQSIKEEQWTQKSLLTIASLLSVLIFCAVLLTHIAINIGERRLQTEWATNKYRELQTVSTLLEDKVSLQQFRTQMLKKNAALTQYIAKPTADRQQALLKDWGTMVTNIPELLGIALFDPNGKLTIASRDMPETAALPDEVVQKSLLMDSDETYTSALEFTPIDGIEKPYIYQVAPIVSPQQKIIGYLVTDNAILNTLDVIQPTFSSGQSPLLVFDASGVLYVQNETRLKKAPIPQKMPKTTGDNLKQSYPELWQQMSSEHFGQFHGSDATFVYLKLGLVNQYQSRYDYYLLSYIDNGLIEERFAYWRNILVFCVFLLTILGAFVILLRFFYNQKQKTSSFSLELANELLNRNFSALIINENGRISLVNSLAAQTLKQTVEELTNKSLQRTLKLENDEFDPMMTQASKGEWRGELKLDTIDGGILRTQIRPITNKAAKSRYLLMTWEDISELKLNQQAALQCQLLSNSALPTALVDAHGLLVKSNDAFNLLIEPQSPEPLNLSNMLEPDKQEQWQRITQQITVQGEWQGQVCLSLGHNRQKLYLQAKLKGHINSEDEIEYIICLFEDHLTSELRSQLADQTQLNGSIMANMDELTGYFNKLTAQSRDNSCLQLIDIAPAAMDSHISDPAYFERHRKKVELQLLTQLPSHFRLARHQLNSLIIIHPDTDATETQEFASQLLEHLKKHNLADGICIGISAYQEQQSLEHFISNANVALKRAKQMGEQNICQAFTRKFQSQ